MDSTTDTQPEHKAAHEQGAEGEIDLAQDLAQELAQDLVKELAQTREQLLRALAEVENVRKRGERAVQEARLYAIERFARDLMAVSDNLQRAVQAAPPTLEEPVRSLIEGVQLTEKSLAEIFTRHGLRAIGARGDRFDPNLHQAVAQIPSDAPSGSVAEVFQAGYVLGDRTVRAAMVAVSLGILDTVPKPEAGPAAEPPAPPSAPSAERIDITT